MPRVGGVYSLLSGSKGSPNTTIQSASYNSQLDDFAQDANLARPITAGGTGATTASGARSNLGLEPVASSGSASDLTTGTLADARLPATMSSKTFSGPITVNGSVYLNSSSPEVRYARTSTNVWRTVVDAANGYLVFQHSTDAFVANFVNALGLSPSGEAVVNGAKVWTQSNDGVGSGLDADLLDGQQGSFYQNASNLNSGTISDSRLPGTQTGKNFTTDVIVGQTLYVGQNNGGGIELGKTNGTAGSAFIDFHTSASVVDYNVRLIADGDTAIGAGTLNIQAGALNHNGNTVWTNSTLPVVSQAEAQAGTGTDARAYTPLRVYQAAKAALAPFVSGNQTYVTNGSGSVGHGLGAKPTKLSAYLVCTTAQNGWGVGDEIEIAAYSWNNGSQTYGMTMWSDTSSIYWKIASGGISIIGKSDGVAYVAAASNFVLRLRGAL